MILSFLKSAFLFFNTYKKAVLIGFVALALGYGAYCTKNWYDKQIQSSYDLGVEKTDHKWSLVQAQNEKETKEYKARQESRIAVLSQELSELRSKNANPDLNGGTKQYIYLQKPESQSPGIDDDMVEIYNESIGATK